MLFNFAFRIDIEVQFLRVFFSLVSAISLIEIRNSEMNWGMCFYFICGRCADDKPYEPTYMVSQEKTKSLGINSTPLEVSLKDTVESLREKNFVSFWDVVFTS